MEDNMSFSERLSFYCLFQGKIANLDPSREVTPYELSSTLFTDYAEKQRLIKLPPGTKMKLTGNGLPEFPEGTIIAKTFYYPDSSRKNNQIIETRLLILSKGKWNLATYQWNSEQNEAYLAKEGKVVQVETKCLDGRMTTINYHIPGKKECISCHRSGNALVPIGPKASNLSIEVSKGNNRINQLTYFIVKGLLQPAKLSAIKSIACYTNTSASLQERTRGYLEINCAHCHQSGGDAERTTLNLGYHIPLRNTGIELNRNNILVRMSQMGEYHMPKLGTTLIDTAGLKLIKNYLKSLN